MAKLLQLRWPHKCLALAVSCLFVASTVRAEGTWSFAVGAGSAQTPFIGSALESSFARFFGAPPSAEVKRRFGLGLGIEGGWIGIGGGALSLGLTHRSTLGRALLVHRVDYERGARRFALPSGFGIFRDPAIARLEYQALTLAQSVALPMRPPRLGARLETSLGWGVALFRTDSAIQSALLDVRSRQQTTAPFLRIGQALYMSKPDHGPVLAIRLDATRYHDGLTSIRLRQELSF